jgi:hypothetical protein
MLAPTGYTAQAWPIAADTADLQAIVRDQAKTIADKEVLLHAYQGNLNAAQTAPQVVSTAVATATGTTIALSGVSGTVQIGSVVAGPPTTVPAGTTILNQQSGVTGGAGSYTTSQATTVSNQSVTLTYQPPGISPLWPAPADPPTLMLIVNDQTALLRSQTMLLQQYQALLNDSQTAPPPSGP